MPAALPCVIVEDVVNLLLAAPGVKHAGQREKIVVDTSRWTHRRAWQHLLGDKSRHVARAEIKHVGFLC